MRDMAILGREREGGSEISEGRKRKSECDRESYLSDPFSIRMFSKQKRQTLLQHCRLGGTVVGSCCRSSLDSTRLEVS